MGFYLNIVLLLGVIVTAVVGRPDGAPASACSTISPSHGGTTPQTSEVPYTVNISSLTNGYIPGQSYTIILSGTATDGIQGFLIQARVMAGNTATGTFTDNGDDQQLVCDGDFMELSMNTMQVNIKYKFGCLLILEDKGNHLSQKRPALIFNCDESEFPLVHRPGKITDHRQKIAGRKHVLRTTGATHTSASEKTMVQLTWNAPPMGTGTILFRYAFADSFTTYWTNLATDTVSEAVTVTSDTVTATTTASTIEASSITVTATSDTVTTTTTTSTIEASSITVTATSDTVTTTTTASTIEASSITVTATSDTVTATTTTSTIEASSITVTVTQTTNATTNTTEASSTSMSTMPSSAPADITSTPSASTTPTAEATPDGGGATGVMAASSVMLMLLASIITLIN